MRLPSPGLPPFPKLGKAVVGKEPGREWWGLETGCTRWPPQPLVLHTVHTTLCDLPGWWPSPQLLSPEILRPSVVSG